MYWSRTVRWFGALVPPSLEYCSALGEVGKLSPLANQTHLVFPGADWKIGERFTCQAQAPTKPQPAPGAAAMKSEVTADLRQLLHGILFPSSNVIFAAQDDDPAKVPPTKGPTLSPNPLASTYGGWAAVENNEAAGDLTTACSNCHDGYREKPTLEDRCK